MSYSAQEVSQLSATTKFTPTTQWYQDKFFHRGGADPALKIQSTARIVKHEERRQKILATTTTLPANVQYVARAFSEVVHAETDRISASDYAACSAELGVTNLKHAQALFAELDLAMQGSVSFSELMGVFSTCSTEGPLRDIVTRICFDAFDPKGCGYVLRPLMKSLKGEDLASFTMAGGEVACTPHMLTALLNVFEDVVRAEDAAILASMGKAARGSQAKPPPQPVSRKFHISYDEFLGHYERDGRLFMAMFPLIVYALTNKRTRTGFAVSPLRKGSTDFPGSPAGTPLKGFAECPERRKTGFALAVPTLALRKGSGFPVSPLRKGSIFPGSPAVSPRRKGSTGGFSLKKDAV